MISFKIIVNGSEKSSSRCWKKI